MEIFSIIKNYGEAFENINSFEGRLETRYRKFTFFFFKYKLITVGSNSVPKCFVEITSEVSLLSWSD